MPPEWSNAAAMAISATPFEHGSMDAAHCIFAYTSSCLQFIRPRTNARPGVHGSIGENSADVVCGTFFHLMETAGRTPISKLLVLDYTVLAFVTTTGRPVRGKNWLPHVTFDSFDAGA